MASNETTEPRFGAGAFERQQRLAQQQIENLRSSAMQQREFADSYTQRRADALGAFREASQQGMQEARRATSASLASAIGSAPQTGLGARYAAGRQAAMDSGNQMAGLAAKGALSEVQIGEQFLERQNVARQQATKSEGSSLAFQAELSEAGNKKAQDYNARIDELIERKQGFGSANESRIADVINQWALLEGDPAVQEWLRNTSKDIRHGKRNLQGSFSEWRG